MTTLDKPHYLTATSLTARQINRRVILNTIHKHQPLSRADAARMTGLQRSTVSLIVDELAAEGWIIESEYGRIPRGRRPIYLTMAPQGRLLGIYIEEQQFHIALSDLNGKIAWTESRKLSGSSTGNLHKELIELNRDLKDQLVMQTDAGPTTLALKGVGVAVSAANGSLSGVQNVVEEVFGVCTVVDSVAVACGEWFLLHAKDAEQAKNHLVSIYAGDQIETGVILGDQPLRGAHGRAGIAPHIQGNGSGATAEQLVERMSFAVVAYDPGLVLITGPMADKAEAIRPALEKRLREIGSDKDILRIVTITDETQLFMKASIAVILNHYLTECSV